MILRKIAVATLTSCACIAVICTGNHALPRYSITPVCGPDGIRAWWAEDNVRDHCWGVFAGRQALALPGTHLVLRNASAGVVILASTALTGFVLANEPFVARPVQDQPAKETEACI